MTDYESQLLSELRGIREALELIALYSVNTCPVKSADNSSEQSCSSPKMEGSVNDQCNQSIATQTSLTNNNNVQRYYFGTPDGNGFEECNALDDPDSIRILYVIETEDGVNGRFYPLSRSMSRLKSNAQAFLLPLCKISTSLDDLSVGTIPQDRYGVVILENGFWKVEQKCVL